MNDFISHVLEAIDRDGSEIAAVFPGLAGLSVVYKFADRLANDVVSLFLPHGCAWAESPCLLDSGVYQSSIIAMPPALTGTLLDRDCSIIRGSMANSRQDGRPGCVTERGQSSSRRWRDFFRLHSVVRPSDVSPGDSTF